MNIKVLTIAADSDTRYDSSMRHSSRLGIQSNISGNVDWFCSGLTEDFNGPFYFQDHIHLATNRNLFSRTEKHRGKLPFGAHFYIQMHHLRFLLKNYEKDKHELTPSTLDPVDK